MQREQNKNKERRHVIWRIGCFYLAAVMLLAVWYVTGDRANAYDEVTELSVTVGYWGGTEYTKKTVSLSELSAACGTTRATYTWINAGNSPGTTEAEGIAVSDILQYSKIDQGSVYYYNFQTQDASTYAKSNQQWTQEQLFGRRYTYAGSFQKALADYDEDHEDYLKNPERHFTVDDIFDYEHLRYTQSAWNDRDAVEPMLALRSKSATWKGYAPASRLDYSGLQTTGKPILMFGQAGRNDITRNLMAQMVTKIHIWFNGSPSITLSEHSLKGKTGTKKTLRVGVTTPDEFLSRQIAGEVKLQSSDSSVATVENDGTVEIKGKGKATISASYQGKTFASTSVIGMAGKGKTEGGGAGNGNGNGNGSGSGNGRGTGTGEGSSGTGDTGGGTTGTSSEAGGLSHAGHASQATGLTSDRHATTSGSSSSASGGENRADGGGSSGSGKTAGKGENIYEISGVQSTPQNSKKERAALRWFLLAAAVAMIGGGIWQTLCYRDQVHWEKRAGKGYEKWNIKHQH